MNAADAHSSLRAALRSLIDLAELHERDVIGEPHPERSHPDWPDRIGSQVLDAAQTVDRVAREYRRVLRGAA
jgi:hypothetical protein